MLTATHHDGQTDEADVTTVERLSESASRLLKQTYTACDMTGRLKILGGRGW